MPYKKDEEFMAYVGHLIEMPSVQRLKEIPHHIHSNRLEHSINVSYTSYRIAKKFGWNARSTARGALLHDLFYYDWRVTSLRRVMLGFIRGWQFAMLARLLSSIKSKRTLSSSICGA